MDTRSKGHLTNVTTFNRKNTILAAAMYGPVIHVCLSGVHDLIATGTSVRVAESLLGIGNHSRTGGSSPLSAGKILLKTNSILKS